MTRIRLAYLRHLYRTIARVEARLIRSDNRDRIMAAAELRKDYSAQSVSMVDQWQRRHGVSRQGRRQWKRQVVSGR